MANVDPKIWGEGLWTFMYSMAASLNENEMNQNKLNAVRTFFTILHLLLPCETCSDNYLSDFEDTPLPTIINKITLYEWINKIENKTNIRLGKPEVSVQQKIMEISQHTTPISDIPIEHENENIFGDNKHLIMLSQILDAQKLLNMQTFDKISKQIQPQITHQPQKQTHQQHQKTLFQRPSAQRSHTQTNRPQIQRPQIQRPQALKPSQQTPQTHYNPQTQVRAQSQIQKSQKLQQAQPQQIKTQSQQQGNRQEQNAAKAKIQNQIQKQAQMSKAILQNRHTRSIQSQKMKAIQQVKQVQQRFQQTRSSTPAPVIQTPKIISISSPMKTLSAKEKFNTPKKPCGCGGKRK